MFIFYNSSVEKCQSFLLQYQIQYKKTHKVTRVDLLRSAAFVIKRNFNKKSHNIEVRTFLKLVSKILRILRQLTLQNYKLTETQLQTHTQPIYFSNYAI